VCLAKEQAGDRQTRPAKNHLVSRCRQVRGFEAQMAEDDGSHGPGSSGAEHPKDADVLHKILGPAQPRKEQKDDAGQADQKSEPAARRQPFTSGPEHAPQAEPQGRGGGQDRARAAFDGLVSDVEKPVADHE
jgi:hypothetical protein